MAFPTFREFIASIAPGGLNGENSSGFLGVVFSLVGDTSNAAAELAVRAPWLLDPSSPDDVLPLIGGPQERRMPRYPSETAAQYRARLHGAWDAYQFGGDESAILGQLDAAGWAGAVIYDPGNADFSPTPYSTHFIVYFPEGTHPVTAPGPEWGSFTWGDGSTYGPVGLSLVELTAIRKIIRKWKSSRWICRGIVFQISGWTYGTGHTWGEADLEWGGTQARVGAGA